MSLQHQQAKRHASASESAPLSGLSSPSNKNKGAGNQAKSQDVSARSKGGEAPRGIAGVMAQMQRSAACMGLDLDDYDVEFGKKSAMDDIGAEASYSKKKIQFASSSPDPETIAHELAHAKQAEDHGTSGGEGLSEPEEASEKEADAVAKKVVSGQKAQVHRGVGKGVMRKKSKKGGSGTKTKSKGVDEMPKKRHSGKTEVDLRDNPSGRAIFTFPAAWITSIEKTTAPAGLEQVYKGGARNESYFYANVTASDPSHVGNNDPAAGGGGDISHTGWISTLQVGRAVNATKVVGPTKAEMKDAKGYKKLNGNLGPSAHDDRIYGTFVVKAGGAKVYSAPSLKAPKMAAGKGNTTTASGLEGGQLVEAVSAESHNMTKSGTGHSLKAEEGSSYKTNANAVKEGAEGSDFWNTHGQDQATKFNYVFVRGLGNGWILSSQIKRPTPKDIKGLQNKNLQKNINFHYDGNYSDAKDTKKRKESIDRQGEVRMRETLQYFGGLAIGPATGSGPRNFDIAWNRLAQDVPPAAKKSQK